MDDKRSTTVLEDIPSPTKDFRNGGPDHPRRRWGWLWIVVLIVVAAAAYRFWPKGGAQPAATTTSSAGGRKGAGGITPVVAVKATKGDIGVYIVDPGSVAPVYTVTVESQISGYLTEVLYKEGDMVQKGQALAEIDPRPYQVQLETAQASLVRDQANLDNARVDLNRYQTLVPLRAVPEQTLATQQALVKSDEGVVQTDQAAIDSAKLNLVYCHITAPITGRVGLRLVDPGNYVQTSSALVVVTQLQPITAVFPIAEDSLPPVIKKWRAGQRLNVTAFDRNMKKLASGYLSTIDNQIDPTTGTVKLRATFDNQDNALFPNQFVNAQLLVEQKQGVTLLPTAAIQRNNQQTYVWFVKPDSTVTVRQIQLGTTEGNETEVTSGVSPGDTVVMTGVDRLQEGSKVNAQIEGASDAQRAS
ncbi:MAG TPA: efflux RND transporter periplasmic adaptor subunit [Terriglobia bacterium]|jgi:multidrug efflux system membrane fusion protein|nr:efflux RND transporter periplasmic adaptor subunit [Terriglobia bacterium]